ncbi:MAG: DEAD/DEAH box helicase [Nevskiaceae bacterium]|nr:MAG: DEAD/DEAH box helicase [Nevskiaceae bacterium]
MSFAELGLNQALLNAVSREGYTTPTPIQQRAIPVVLEGHDLLAAAQTGTGKTAGFTLPMLHKLASVPLPAKRYPRALVLTPTRELAAQVAESIATYGKDLPLKSTVIFGGVGHQPQIDALRRGVDIIIATPGRLLEHINDRICDLSKLEFFVLDEADRMLDMGFIHDIKRVLKVLPAKRQNLLFSATFSDEIRTLAKTFLHAPREIDIAPRNSTIETVSQKVTYVEQRHKRELLSYLMRQGDWQQVLVFARMKHGANRICDYLNEVGLPAAALHGNKSQSARTKALADFKAKKIRALVATDIAARGIDIDQLPHVINFELPNVPEDYVHRIGRTGRAGNDGEALSFCAPDERAFLRDIQRLIKREIPVLTVQGFVPSAAADKPEPPRPPRPPQGGRGRQGGGQGRSESRGGGGGGRSSAPAAAGRGDSWNRPASPQPASAAARPAERRNGGQPARAESSGGGFAPGTGRGNLPAHQAKPSGGGRPGGSGRPGQHRSGPRGGR